MTCAWVEVTSQTARTASINRRDRLHKMYFQLITDGIVNVFMGFSNSSYFTEHEEFEIRWTISNMVPEYLTLIGANLACQAMFVRRDSSSRKLRNFRQETIRTGEVKGSSDC